jgi:hypothetical protein
MCVLARARALRWQGRELMNVQRLHRDADEWHDSILVLELRRVVREEADLTRACLSDVAYAHVEVLRVQLSVAAGEPAHAGWRRTGAGVQVVPARGAVVRASHGEVGVAAQLVAVARGLPQFAYGHNVQSWAPLFGHGAPCRL